LRSARPDAEQGVLRSLPATLHSHGGDHVLAGGAPDGDRGDLERDDLARDYGLRLAEVRGQVQAGQLKILGVMDTQRNALFPDVPTFQEQGVNVVFYTWRGLALPKGVAPAPLLLLLRVNALQTWRRLLAVRQQSRLLTGVIGLFICGYLLYSSIFAVVGVTVNHHDEMQQMSMLVGLPLIIAIIVLTVDTVNNPDSTLSFWLSMIPFTSPVVMMGRLAFGAPTGELIISIVILLVTMIGMMWLAGKIYRGMILYTGKKVGVKDAIEWLQRSLTSKKNE